MDPGGRLCRLRQHQAVPEQHLHCGDLEDDRPHKTISIKNIKILQKHRYKEFVKQKGATICGSQRV